MAITRMAISIKHHRNTSFAEAVSPHLLYCMFSHFPGLVGHPFQFIDHLTASPILEFCTIMLAKDVISLNLASFRRIPARPGFH